MNITDMVRALQGMRNTGGFSTLLGIGPMSPMVLEGALELGKEQDFPILFIASRNQVDMRLYGGGYVSSWDQEQFCAAIRSMTEKVGFDGLYYICRDHGGPWQRDEERAAALPEKEAMTRSIASYLADLDAGFDLLHIDPTKDPHMENAIDMDVVLERTVRLIAAVEAYREEKGMAPVGYEVGTEETNGGLTGLEAFETFIGRLMEMLGARGLPKPQFIVGQTGTLVRLTENAGRFSIGSAQNLSAAAARFGMELKEHNSDYLSDEALLLHPALGVGSSNVAPEFGVAETRAYLSLARLERELYDEGIVRRHGNLPQALSRAAVETGRWRKWMVDEKARYSVERVWEDAALTLRIAEIGGHYTFEMPAVAAEIQALFGNLERAGVPARRYVLDEIKRCIGRYVNHYRLRGLTGRLREQVEGRPL